MLSYIVHKWVKMKNWFKYEHDIASLRIFLIEQEFRVKNVEGLIEMHQKDIVDQENEVKDMQVIVDNGDTSKEARDNVNLANERLEQLRVELLNLQTKDLVTAKQQIQTTKNTILTKTVFQKEIATKA